MTSQANPLVSILMTSYNTEKFIGTAIQSIIDQTHQNWELLVADDCSTDKTQSIIDAFSDSRIKRHHNPSNINYLRTRNKLFDHVKGEYITILDSDDKYVPEYLETKLKVFITDLDLGICGCNVFLTDSNLNVYGIKELNTTDEEIKKDMINKHQFSGSAVMVKREVVDTVGIYRDFFHGIGHEDYDWYSRIVEKFKAVNLSKPLYYYRQHPQSESKMNVMSNIYKKNSHLFVQQFIRERRNFGADSLQRNDSNAIIMFANEICMPYINDPSKIYRDQMWPYAHRKMYSTAFKYAFKALSKDPFTLQNYKAPLACLKDNLFPK